MRLSVLAALTTHGRHAWTYHEGSFYPLKLMLAFADFISGFVNASYASSSK